MELTPIFVSDHCLERVMERCPELRGDVASVVEGEVREAIQAGRRATRKPRSLVPRGRRPRAARPAARFVWTPGHDRIYVVRRARRDWDGATGWLAITVLLPRLPSGYSPHDGGVEELAA